MTEQELTDAERVDRLHRLSVEIKLDALDMVAIEGFGYFGQALSAGEQFAVLFGELIEAGHDRFVLSPGHYAVVFYAAAARTGLLDPEELRNYGGDGSLLEAISTERTPLVDLTCGSLGQGLSGAVGLALASRLADDSRHVYAFLSDGEMEEGQIWEAAMFAGHHHVTNLTVLLDANGSQVDGPISSVTTVEPITDKWAAFGWDVHEVDGHDVAAIWSATRAAQHQERPRVVVCRTNILGRLTSIPPSADGHFLKINEELRHAIRAELLAHIGE